MLRITIHEDEATWRMQLEGKLAGALAQQAEEAWRGARLAGRGVEIDLTGVTRVDEAGMDLLRALKQAGAQFRAKGVEMNAMLGEAGEEPAGQTHFACIRKLLGMSALALAIGVFPVRAQQAAPAQATAAAAPATVRLTLQQAVALALRQNPQVVIANLNLAESQENRTEARSALLPQASFNASDAVMREDVQALFGKRIPNIPGHVGPFWVLEAGGAASVPLFDLTLWRRWQASKENVSATRAEQGAARESNAQLVVSQYLGSLRAAADVQAAKSRLDLAKALFDLATDMQTNGAGTAIDTLRAHVQYQNELQRSADAGAELKIELFGLNRLLNLDPQQNIELADQPSFFETPAVAEGQDLAQAYKDRPEMQAVLARERSAELAKEAAKDSALPRLSLAGSWNLEGTTPTNMIPVYAVGASLNVPLFTGGRIQAQTAAEDIELKKLAQTEIEVRNLIALEVKSASAEIDAARVEVEAANLGVSLAAESVRQARDRFRAGVANNIEVITAQDELARANDNQIAALYKYNQSRADLARATGRVEELYAK
ncbi:MAG TPA: TolC family protein [Bryobacteraceae bacterium]|nr:TolC family protein [Bryobacteraceae bacterium]